MGGGVFGNTDVESRLEDTVNNVPSPDGPATACTPVGRRSDEERGTKTNGGSLGLRSSE